MIKSRLPQVEVTIMLCNVILTIGTAKAFKRPEGWKVTPDDRMVKIPILNGVVMQDNGIIDGGETLSCAMYFDLTNWATVKNYWINRTLVAVVDHAGNALGNRRVVIKDYTTVDFHPGIVKATIEFWNV